MSDAPAVLNDLHRALRSIRRREIIECRNASPTSLYRVAARLFTPADGRRCFQDPFPIVGKVVAVVLSRRPIIDGDEARDQVYLRGFKARYDAASGLTLWDETTATFAYDVADEGNDHHDQPDWVLPPRNIELIQAAIDLNRACVRASIQRHNPAKFGVLPPTLLAIPSGLPLQPEPTPFVRIRAALDHTSISEAWHRLVAHMRVPAEQTGMDVDLVDSRLVHEQACLSLSEHHDLRPFLGRAVTNPARSAATQPFPTGRRVLDVLRSRLRPDVSSVCTDEDLRRALLDPTGPLMVSRLASIQTWRPPLTRCPRAAFQFEEAGVKADLWSTPWKWADEVTPRLVRGAGFTSYQRPALCA